MEKDKSLVNIDESINKLTFKHKILMYKNKPSSLILYILIILATLAAVSVTLFIIAYILISGVPHLSLDLFAWEYNSDNVSMTPALVNTIVMTLACLLVATPVGIGAAIYLVEYSKKGSKWVKLIRLTTETLSGIPSIVYGLFGYMLFVTALGWSYSFLAGVITLAIMILPLIMRTTEEALKSVPDTFREGSFGLGAGKLRTIVRIILPSAVPGILAGVILAIGRIVGETAALIFTAGTGEQMVDGLFSSHRTLAIHMYMLSGENLHTDQASATAVVLLVLVIGINALSAFIAKKIAKGKKDE